ncbi:hypothetical protein GCM10011342_15770 [Aquisalinus flavus]|uniref:Glycosyl hydrolase 94 catalytic domain-containing protein n=1 Tax=Aquisalinus flavus TaxID=1526572 RepID=A0A8J2V2V2_9PROT|nr:hypothetical protein GCM10011342_15770 [Aquisalinus flavus]
MLRAGTAAIALPWLAPVMSASATGTSIDGRSTRIGRWEQTRAGLPAYRYEGSLPALAFDKTGRDAQQPPDPAFILGNYRLTAFAHVSGILQLLTGERVWARVNAAGDRMLYGDNHARLTVSDSESAAQAYDLVGMQSLAIDPARTTRRFGPGFAHWGYALSPELHARRVVSARPSLSLRDGNPSLVITVTLNNSGSRSVAFSHEEGFGMRYVPCNLQRIEPDARVARYASSVTNDATRRIALSQTRHIPVAFTVEDAVDAPNLHDLQPVNVFLHAHSSDTALSLDISGSDDERLLARIRGDVPAGGTVSFDIVIGLTYGDMDQAAALATDMLSSGDRDRIDDGLYSGLWATQLPDMTQEQNPVFRTEMPWHAHALEAMATYSAYFDETFVPQGTIYTYEDGENISNRDNLQALLPLCYSNPPLAKSCLRHVLKQTTRQGEIKRGTSGFGYMPPSIYKESDAQLYMFMAVGEYLRVTRDHALLNERVEFYPVEGNHSETVLNVLKRHFVYLRDEVGTGEHGLIRILNSDWSDSFFHLYSPNLTAASAESHLNSAMALAILPRFIAGLRAAGIGQDDPFIAALSHYHDDLSAAYMTDLGDRTFSARAYLNGGKPRYGVDVVCLEPQGFLLQIPDLPEPRKAAIYRVVKEATFAPEKVGFRIREKPIFGTSGGGEDGGFWFALEGQMVLGVSSFDKAEAEKLLETMSFHNFAKEYPDYVLGRWTHTDSMQSSLHPREGLMNYWKPSLEESGIGYCSHPHSWPLYNYFHLRDVR